MRYFIIERMDGLVEWMNMIDTADPYEELAKWQRYHGKAKSFVESRENDRPPDTCFREAWRRSGNTVVEDMSHARAIRLDQIRAARNERLAASDKDVAKLDGAKVPDELKAKRQGLRDIPVKVAKHLDQLQDRESLIAYEPEWPE